MGAGTERAREAKHTKLFEVGAFLQEMMQQREGSKLQGRPDLVRSPLIACGVGDVDNYHLVRDGKKRDGLVIFKETYDSASYGCIEDGRRLYRFDKIPSSDFYTCIDRYEHFLTIDADGVMHQQDSKKVIVTPHVRKKRISWKRCVGQRHPVEVVEHVFKDGEEQIAIGVPEIRVIRQCGSVKKDDAQVVLAALGETGKRIQTKRLYSRHGDLKPLVDSLRGYLRKATD